MLDELHWGNRYFLSMQDEQTGAVWYSVGGDELENVWTDSSDDASGDERSIDTTVVDHVQFKFSWVQRMIAARFAGADRCARAADDAWRAGLALGDPGDASTLTLSTAVLAAPLPPRRPSSPALPKWVE